MNNKWILLGIVILFTQQGHAAESKGFYDGCFFPEKEFYSSTAGTDLILGPQNSSLRIEEKKEVVLSLPRDINVNGVVSLQEENWESVAGVMDDIIREKDNNSYICQRLKAKRISPVARLGASYRKRGACKIRTQGILCLIFGCGERFLCQSKLKRHLLGHTKERPFACGHCGKRFNQKSSALKSHLERHMKKGDMTREEMELMYANTRRDSTPEVEVLLKEMMAEHKS